MPRFRVAFQKGISGSFSNKITAGEHNSRSINSGTVLRNRARRPETDTLCRRMNKVDGVEFRALVANTSHYVNHCASHCTKETGTICSTRYRMNISTVSCLNQRLVISFFARLVSGGF